MLALEWGLWVVNRTWKLGLKIQLLARSKGTDEAVLPLFHRVRSVEKIVVQNRKGTLQKAATLATLVLDFQPAELREISFYGL